jgi:hypothetical protein
MAGRRRYHPACPRISDAKRDRHLRLGGPVTEEHLPRSAASSSGSF